eukprot:1577068-Pleurochrysis_carterae.AAC.1
MALLPAAPMAQHLLSISTTVKVCQEIGKKYENFKLKLHDLIGHALWRRRLAPRAHRAREPKLCVGETVSVAVRHFGKAYGKSLYGRACQSDKHRGAGTVVSRAEHRWLVDFNDEGEVIAWERFKLRLVSRPEAAPGMVMEDESDDEQPVEEEQPAAEAELQTDSTEVTSARGARGGAGKGGGRGRG